MSTACFDVIGTCFEFTPVINTISQRLGPTFKSHNIDPSLFFFSWFYAAQRDFTYVSQAGYYVPIAEVLKGTLARALRIAGLRADEFTNDDIEAIAKQFKSLEAREGLKDCWEYLQGKGVECYAVTNGGHATTKSYFEAAGIKLADERILSCDEIKVAKADVRVYRNAETKMKEQGTLKEDGERWFVAAHMWDLCAAKAAGWKTAYVDHEEFEGCEGVFGEADVKASSLMELARKMIE
ncbi:hypothetical protein YB2330_001541 [Saitoella coloradoensis]